MAPAPYKATLKFRGRRTGQPYVQAVSGSDVANAFITFDKSGLTFWTPPEDVDLVDIAVITGGTDTKRLQLYVNNADSNHVFLHGEVLTSIPLPRLAMPVGIAQGATIQFNQAA